MPHVSAVGPFTLPLRLLDGFCLNKESASGAEEVDGLDMLEKGEGLLGKCS